MLRSVFISLLLLLATTAVAIACGIYIPREGNGVIGQERALIRHVDGIETIVLELSVTDATSDAAWILPVPNPAEVALGDDRIFDELAEITAPRIEVRYYDPNSDGVGSAAPGSAPVTVFSRQMLGPFDVVSLTGEDADAVAAWLEENGFTFPAELPDILAPYIADDWAFAAVRLAPGEAGGEIGGQLDPLAFTFASEQTVYPLRPAALGVGGRPLFLYVLTHHKVIPEDLAGANYSSTLQYANAIAPADLGEESLLTEYVTEPLYLTKYWIDIWDVRSVQSDLYFSQAADDAPFQSVEYRMQARSNPLSDMFRCAWLPFLGMAAVGMVAFRRHKR